MQRLGTGLHRHWDPRNLMWSEVRGPRVFGAGIETADVAYKYWNDTTWWGYQNGFPACVGFAWTHLLTDGPVTQLGRPPVDPMDMYRLAQGIDREEGRNYSEGATTLAGVKAAQRLGYVGEYRWLSGLSEAIDVVLRISPIVVGSIWTPTMYETDDEGILRTGRVARASDDSHEYVINGINVVRGFLRIKNSWGKGWGKFGRALLPFEDYEWLDRQGLEAVAARELRKAA